MTTIEEILHDIEWDSPEYVYSKYSKEPFSLKKAIETYRDNLYVKRNEYVKKLLDSGYKYSAATKLAEKYVLRKSDFNRLNEIESMLKGHPSEAAIKSIRSKIVGIVRKLGIPIQKEHKSSMVRGWSTYTSGMKVSAEPSYHPYEYVSISYYISSSNEARFKQAQQELDLLKKEIEKLGYKVKVVDRGLEVRP